MSVTPPQPFLTTIQGPVGPVTVSGIPSTFDINIDSLPEIKLNIDNLPEIKLNIDHIPKIELGVDPVELRLTELPSIRGHLPADFCVGLSLMGMELMNVRLCGEAQIITEPYKPNPCEICQPIRGTPVAVDTTPQKVTPAGAKQ